MSAARPGRRSISKALRFAILKRDGFRCRYCGRGAPDVELQVDHMLSVAQGGSNEESNLAAACADCNGGKGASSITTKPVPLSAMHAIDFAAQIGTTRWYGGADCGAMHEVMTAWHRYLGVPAIQIVDMAMKLPSYPACYGAIARQRRGTPALVSANAKG